MADIDVLTAREMEILSLTGSGHSAHEIAGLLGISRCAVENHRRRIYHKLGVAGQSEAVFRGLALHLLAGPLRPPRAESPSGRELVVMHARCVMAAELVTRTVLGGGRALVAVRSGLPCEVHVESWSRIGFTAVLVDPVPGDWLLPLRLGARTVAVPSAPPEPAAVAEAVAHGACAVLWLRDVPEHLCAVLDLVARGYVVVGSRDRQEQGPRLTARERDVLASIAAGHTIRQTARLLGIASKTVESTRARLFRKLGARNRSQALAIAYRAGLVAAGQDRPAAPVTGHDSPGPPART
ncbi:helix-turn-helix domain-containing protein [Nonomuraea zeae]|nr:helix-turn-helix transcriptional regulator [Nonomuraea zeae]